MDPVSDFHMAVTNPDVTDNEIEELFNEWVLNSNERTSMSLLIGILLRFRPELAKKLMLKYSSLLN